MAIDYSIIGRRFGRLEVIAFDHVDKKVSFWKCKCDCGKEIVTRRGMLTSGDKISCGCYREEHKHEFGLKHGLTNTPLYTVWGGIVQRCTNPNSSKYYMYGGRGIKLCDEWRNDFLSFYNWAITHGYEKGLTIDRVDTNGDYTPENCRWCDRLTQQNNMRRNHRFTYNGTTHTLAEWSRILHVNAETLRYRIKTGNLTDFYSMSELITGKEEE